MSEKRSLTDTDYSALKGGIDALGAENTEAHKEMSDRIERIENTLCGLPDDPGLFERVRNIERLVLDWSNERRRVIRGIWVLTSGVILIAVELVLRH